MNEISSSLVLKVVVVALKSYFDGGQTEGRSMTLAAVSAHEIVWSELEPAWAEVLKAHGAPHLHMKEVIPRIKEFEGWTKLQRDALLDDLINLLREFRGNPRIRRFSCSVDLAAHRRWAPIRQHPSPERLCSRIVFPHIVNWYATFPDTFLDVLDVWFDQNEGFMTHIHEDWQDRRFRRKHPVFGLIRTMAPADMKRTIPLQIADMGAWARNRIESKDPNDMNALACLAYRITNATLRWEHYEVGVKAMAQSTFPEEGVRRERLFEQARKRSGSPPRLSPRIALGRAVPAVSPVHSDGS